MSKIGSHISDIIDAFNEASPLGVVEYNSPEGRRLLNCLDITSDQVRTINGQILAAYNEKTDFDVRYFSGIAAYLSAIRYSRSTLRKNWKGEHEGGSEFIVHRAIPDLKILAFSGDKNVCNPNRGPQPKNDKGASTVSAVASNQRVLFPEMNRIDSDQAGYATFLFLYYIDSDDKTIRSELSLPQSMNPETSQVNRYIVRIFLPSIEFDDHAPIEELSETPEPEFDIVRKMQL